LLTDSLKNLPLIGKLIDELGISKIQVITSKCRISFEKSTELTQKIREALNNGEIETIPNYLNDLKETISSLNQLFKKA
jgi:hypothetical protein